MDKELNLRFNRGSVSHFQLGALAENVPIKDEAHYLLKGVRVTLNKREITQLMNPGTYLFAYGEIIFEDVFAISHKLKFCFPAASPVPIPLRYAEKCTEYNTTDISKPAPATSVIPNVPLPPEIVCTKP